MKNLLALLAVLCLVSALPAAADTVPDFLADDPELTEPVDGEFCDEAPKASVDRFPGADTAFLASCTITTTCGSWYYSSSCGCVSNVTLQKRNCEDKCCSPGGGCFYSGVYTQSRCTNYPCGS